ncbi:MAG: alpha/beta fold hydrolase [Pseudomonadota bacterium]
MRSRVKLIVVGLIVGLVSGCASQPTLLLDAATAGLGLGEAEEEILYATVRSPSEDGQLIYGGDRAGSPSYGSVSVRIPPDRQQGEINYPSGRVNPQRDFIATRIAPMGSAQAFQTVLDARLTQTGDPRPGLSLFVHGYNTDFAEGVFLNAQIVHDFNAPGVPVHFSWASAGLPQGYLYDLESANIARDDLALLISQLASTRAEELMLVAHSMGGMVLMEALRQLGLEGRSDVLSRISAVVLAAPDIDIDVFEEQLRALEPRTFPMLVFVSRRDPALRVSSRLRGRAPRVGDGSAIERLVRANIDVIDLTEINGNRRLEHTKFASSPLVINMIRQAEAVRRSLDAAPGEGIELFEANVAASSDVAVFAGDGDR